MDRNALYYHFANLGLMLIGFLSIQGLFSPIVFMLLMCGTITGFFVSWQIRKIRLSYMDTFIGMLSLAAVIIIFGKAYNIAISFENILRLFSLALAWLTLFQSFGAKTGKSYAMLQFISVCFLITSAALALEQESFYITALTLFLFVFVFTMRLSLVCERERKGSVIIGDQDKAMSLYQQIKVAALMFSFILIAASFMYPFVPRFENLSLRWIPSTLIGVPQQAPLIKLVIEKVNAMRHDKKTKSEQFVDDNLKKRETRDTQKPRSDEQRKNKSEGTIRKFSANKVSKDTDVFKIGQLIIKSDKNKVPLNAACKLEAEFKMIDGGIVPVTEFVDWRLAGKGDALIGAGGNLTPKKEGYIYVSASYLGNFSNDVKIKILKGVFPANKKNWLRYIPVFLLQLLILLWAGFMVRAFVRSRRLAEIAVKSPREFIKKLYIALCKNFQFYGTPKSSHTTPREFLESVRSSMSSNIEPMLLLTEEFLEARFSMHPISIENSRKALTLFHEARSVLEKKTTRPFWGKFLSSVVLLEVLMVPKEIKS